MIFSQVTLKNFGRHEDLTVNFTEGINAILGPNEGGKSTILWAMAYAMFGARVLPESLDEYVTYGKPASSLRVGVVLGDYRISRGRSGAELHGPDVTVTGQVEVTRFCEKLLGITTDLVGTLMVANQGEIRGVLESNTGSVVTLIEKLADLQTLDALVTKIQEQLPSGSTRILDDQIARLQAVEAPAALDTAEDEEALRQLQEQVKGLESHLALLSQVRPPTEAMASLRILPGLLKRRASVQTTLEELRQRVVAQLPDDVPDADLAELERQAALFVDWFKARDAFKGVGPSPFQWEGTNAAFFLEKARAETAQAEAKRALAAAETRQALAKAAKHIGALCPTCGATTHDPVAAAAHNKVVDDERDVAAKEVAACRKAVLDTLQDLAGYNDVVKRDAAVRTIARLFPQYIQVVDTLPATLEWIGGEGGNPTLDLAIAKRQRADFTAAVRRQEQAKTDLAIYEEQLTDLQEELNAIDRVACEQEVSAYDQAQAESSAVRADLADKRSESMSYQETIQRQQAEQARHLDRYTQSQEALTQARKDLGLIGQHNDLIGKLRGARPLIAGKLWGTVLGAVSHYFTRMRGVESVVSRTEAGFTVNGKGVGTLSGSTKDVLGLAIRIALVRTFLPNCHFLILDEPQAAADESRSAALLGVITAAGFPQVLLVSHEVGTESVATSVTQV